MLNQIEELKRQNKAIDEEKEILRLELGKLNENYVKLTNKYVDLTDLLAIHKLPKQSNPISTNFSIGKNQAPNCFSNSQLLYPNDSGIDSYNDEIDLKLQDILVQYNISNSLLTKVDRGIYLFNNKKLNIKVVNGKVLVRVGGGSTPLLEFLKANKIIDKSLNVSVINQNQPYIESEERLSELKLSPEILEENDLLSALSSKRKTRNVTPNNKSMNRSYLKDYEKAGDKAERDEVVSKSILSDNSMLKIAKEKENQKKKSLFNSKSIDKKQAQTNSSNTFASNNILKSKNFRDVSPILAKKGLT